MKITKQELVDLIKEELDALLDERENPCWKGYEMVGMKEKDGKQVPNCVPMEENNDQLRETAKGKKYSKTVTNPETGRKKKVSYGAKGYTIAPGTSRGDSYCARSYGIKMRLSKKKRNDPNTPNNLSRKKWKCKGKKSAK